MLMVPTELRESPIQGVGVFLLSPVKKGELVWRFDSRVDRVYTQSELDSLPAVARDFIHIHAYWNKEKNLWVLCGDNAKYYNHSLTPSTISTGRGFADDIAAEDLPIGAELTNNYYEFHDDEEELAKMGLREGTV